MTGIDISASQGDQVPGNWEFIVVKLSEAQSQPNFRFDRQWADAARTTRGVYHYARPLWSTGAVQGNFFASAAMAKGFQPGKDLWQLDAEDGLNEGTSGTTWRVFINDFMATATARLGRRGFLYAGWPFLVAHGLADLPYKFMWWLPDYGPDNGADHGWAPGLPDALVVIHQFTSHPLDQNRVVNGVAYAQASPPPAPPAPAPKADYMPPVKLPPIVSSMEHPLGGSISLGVDGGTFALPLGKPNYGSPHADGIKLEPGVGWSTIRAWKPGDPGKKAGGPGTITILKSNGAKFVY